MLKLLSAAGAAFCIALGGVAARADDVVLSQWGTSLSDSEFAVALDGGFFKKAGAPITGVVATGGGGTAVQAVIASDLGYGVVSLSAAIDAIRHDIPIKIVNVASTYVDTNVVATKGSATKTMADLKGKSMGVFSAGGATDGFAALAIQKAGLQQSDVKRVALTTTNGVLTGLEKGVVPAVTMIQPVLTTNADEFQTIFEGTQLGAVVQVVGIATDDTIKAHPDQLRAILLARRDAIRAMVADPDMAIATIGHYYKNVPPALLRQMLATGYFSEGALDIDGMNRTIEGSRLIGVFQGDVDWSKMLDGSFLPK